MNRRIVGVLVAVLTLGLFLVVLHFGGLAKSLESYYVSEDEWADIINSREEDTEFSFSHLKFNGYSLNIADDRAYYSITENARDLNPVVSLSGGYDFAIKGEQISLQNIENNIHQEIMIYNKKSYRKLELVSTTLPIVNIDFDTNDGSAPSTRENEPFRMTVFDNRAKTINRVTTTDGQAHRRGNVSFGADKPNITMKLTQESVGENTRSNPQRLLGMPESDSWILSGMYYDYEKVRDAFAAIMWQKINQNSFDVSNSFDFRYVEVIMNGNYSGLYLLGSKPSPVAITSKTPDDSHPDIMYKIEDMDDIGSFVTNQTESLMNYKQETKTNDNLARETLRNYWSAILGDDISAIESVTDMKNAVDFHLFVNFSQNADIPRAGISGYKNAYISFKWDGEKYRAIFTPWDFDIALGSNSLWNNYYDIKPEDNYILQLDSIAALRRNGSNEGDKLVRERYWKLRQGVLSESKIDEIIDKLQLDIYNSGAFRRNQERWENSNHNDPNVRLDDFRTHIHQRLAYLDSYYSSDEYLNEPYQEIPNYITEYLNTGTLLSPDDPNYETKQEDIVEEVELYEENPEEFLFW